MRIKLTIEYTGTRFSGWQRQQGRLTIQEKIEDALFKIFHEKTVIYGASRTDAGVHAEGQVAHFIPPMNLPKIDYVRMINLNLPEDIRIVSSEILPDSFHARESALCKLYEYYIFNQSKPSKNYHSTSWWVPDTLDISSMNDTCQYLLGEHDFTSFQSSGSYTSTTLRTILEASWRYEENFLIFSIKGTGFLKYMVRNIVGTLCLVGNHKISSMDFKNILEKKNRSSAGVTAEARGLVLKKIFY